MYSPTEIGGVPPKHVGVKNNFIVSYIRCAYVGFMKKNFQGNISQGKSFVLNVIKIHKLLQKLLINTNLHAQPDRLRRISSIDTLNLI